MEQTIENGKIVTKTEQDFATYLNMKKAELKMLSDRQETIIKQLETLNAGE